MHMALQFSDSETTDKAASVPSAAALLLAHLALVLLRILAIAILASPLPILWLIGSEYSAVSQAFSTGAVASWGVTAAWFMGIGSAACLVLALLLHLLHRRRLQARVAATLAIPAAAGPPRSLLEQIAVGRERPEA